MTAPQFLEFIYTGLFERTRQGILDDDALLELERVLLWHPRVFLLFVYTKTKQAVLTPQERAAVRRLVKELQEE